MRGVTTVVIGIILLVVSIVLVLIFLMPYLGFGPESSESTHEPETDITDTYDYSSYLLGSSTGSYDECDRLKNAIKYAMITGRPYKVDEIIYGGDLVSEVSFPLIGDCPEEDILINIGSGLDQTVCRFKTITTNEKVGESDYGGLSDMTLLDYGNCTYYHSSYSVLPVFSVFNVIGPQVETVNTNPNTINTYYSPDHLYIKNGDYVHYPGLASFKNIAAFNNAYNGGGRLKIYVGNVTSINGECKFNIYFCPRSAIAGSTADSSIDVFKIFRDLEIYRTYMLPYYVRDFSDLVEEMSGYEKEAYYWNFYDVELDRNYDVETIINAIKSGLYSNVISRGYYFAHPHWNIQKDSGIYLYDSDGEKTGECWNTAYDDMISSDLTWNRTRSIRFNCGGDGCSGTLRIKVALRKDSKSEDIDGDGEEEELTYISGIISFCDT